MYIMDNSEFKEKYLKYKNKYLENKSLQRGGASPDDETTTLAVIENYLIAADATNKAAEATNSIGKLIHGIIDKSDFSITPHLKTMIKGANTVANIGVTKTQETVDKVEEARTKAKEDKAKAETEAGAAGATGAGTAGSQPAPGDAGSQTPTAGTPTPTQAAQAAQGAATGPYRTRTTADIAAASARTATSAAQDAHRRARYYR